MYLSDIVCALANTFQLAILNWKDLKKWEAIFP